MKKLIHKIINEFTKGCDVYYNNGSLWLIFTENKKWVLEFTEDGTLWFNFSFFKGVFELVNLDVMENQDHITVWFEDRFLSKPKVKESHHVDVMKFFDKKMENTIGNGVKEIEIHKGVRPSAVKDTIENGVKETTPSGYLGSIEMKGKIVHQIESPKQNNEVEDTIQNGVKRTEVDEHKIISDIKDVIQNGVKETIDLEMDDEGVVEYYIQNGVKETLNTEYMPQEMVEETIENGVKHTIADEFGDLLTVEDTIQNGVKDTHHKIHISFYDVEDIVENGVKETKRSYNGSRKQRTKYVIENGVLETKELYWENTPIIDDVIGNGVKEIKTPGKDGDLLGFLDFMSDNNTDSVPQLIDDVIVNGINQTKAAFQTIYNPMNFSPEIREEKRISDVTDVIDNGVKELQPLPAQDGNRDWGNYYHRQEDRTKPHTEYVNDVISNGIKKTIWRKVENFPEYENRIIVNGVLINNSKDWEIL